MAFSNQGVSLARPTVAFAAVLFVSACLASAIAFLKPAHAQSVVAPSCPQGYELSGSQCVQAAPAPSCPTGYAFSNGKCVAIAATPTTTTSGDHWVFVARRSLGVTNGRDLDGATVCVVSNSPAEAAVAAFFRNNGITYEPVAQGNEFAAVGAYLSAQCDTVVVKAANAVATVNNSGSPNDHMILPDRMAGSATGTSTTVTSQPQPEPADLAYPLQAELKRIGCLTGLVDGIWGRGSRAALTRFGQLSGLNLGTEPSQRALTEARNRQAGYCPVVTQAPVQQVDRCNSGDYAFCRPRAQEYCEGESGNSCLDQELVTCLRNEIGCTP